MSGDITKVMSTDPTLSELMTAVIPSPTAAEYVPMYFVEPMEENRAGMHISPPPPPTPPHLPTPPPSPRPPRPPPPPPSPVVLSYFPCSGFGGVLSNTSITRV